MVKISFSAKETGACSLCQNHRDCHIQQTITRNLQYKVNDKNDNEMEIVVYRCPEFLPTN